jgi:hypothetical protein
MLNKIKSIFRVSHKVVKCEIEEIKNSEVSDEDKEQAEFITNIVVSVLVSYGFVVSAAAQPIIKKAVALAIRDLKNGVKSPNKLIIGRIMEAIKEEMAEDLSNAE